jgi:hypothetical protein
MPYVDPDYQRRYQAEYRARQDPEKRREYQRLYYSIHRPKMLEKGRRYRAWRATLVHAGFTSAA